MLKSAGRHLVAIVSAALILFGGTVTAVLAGAQGASASRPFHASQRPHYGGTLTIGMLYDFPNPPDPLYAYPSNSATQEIMDAVYDPLFRMTDSGKLEPALALSYRHNPSNTVFTLTLRQGVKFQDGEKFNSAAVVDQFQRLLNKTNACTCLGLLAPLESVSAKGPYQVVFKLRNPWSTFPQDALDQGEAYIAAPRAVANEGKSFGHNPVGTGPFKFVNWIPGAYATVVRNPHYWGKKPYLNHIIFKGINNETTRLQTVESGGAQLMVTASGATIEAAKAAGLKANVPTAPGTVFLPLNLKSGPTANVYVRQAMAYALNRKLVSQLAYADLAPAAYGPFVAKNSKWYGGIQWPSYNLAKAKALMAKYSGPPITVTFTTTADAIGEGIAHVLQQDWGAIGITVNVNPVAIPTWVADQESGNFQVIYGYWADLPNADSLANYLSAGGVANRNSYSNPAVNQDLALYQRTSRPSVQMKVIKAALEKVNFDTPDIFMVGKIGGFIYNSTVHNVPPSEFTGPSVLDPDYIWIS